MQNLGPSEIVREATASSTSDSVKRPRVLLVGNPNCGKTTLFNFLTQNRHKVANYPGVTVEKRSGFVALEGLGSCEMVDLPGIYTLTGSSEDERIAIQEVYAAKAAGDLIVAVVDSSSLERSLYIVSELQDLQVPMVVALTMGDIAKRDGITIHEILLERELAAPVVSLGVQRLAGAPELKRVIASALTKLSQYSSPNTAKCSVSPEISSLSKIPLRPEITAPDPQLQASERYRKIREILLRTVKHSGLAGRSRSERIDRLVLHPFWGFALFVLVVTLLFQAVFAWASWPMDKIELIVAMLGDLIAQAVPPGELRSLLVDGVLAGVGSVIVFVPQIAVLFFLIGILEESGYLCRAAVLMDRIMRQVGLQGRSFIPLLSSFACAVPGIMATRTIPSKGDRLLTILVAPLMSCSARLPVYTVLIGAFVPSIVLFGFFSVKGLVLLALYLMGIIAAGAVALLLKQFVLPSEPAIFMLELPRYRWPRLQNVLIEVWDRVLLFLKNAGTVIIACSVVLWFLATHPKGDGSNEADLRSSYAGMIGQAIEPVIRPLGYDWEIGVALLASFAAREVFVSSLATIYSLEGGEESLQATLAKRNATGEGFGPATAASLLVFYVLACQCVSTLAVVRRETGSWRYPALMFAYMTVLAYISAYATFELMQFAGFRS